MRVTVVPALVQARLVYLLRFRHKLLKRFEQPAVQVLWVFLCIKALKGLHIRH